MDRYWKQQEALEAKYRGLREQLQREHAASARLAALDAALIAAEAGSWAKEVVFFVDQVEIEIELQAKLRQVEERRQRQVEERRQHMSKWGDKTSDTIRVRMVRDQ
jgi:hypothetical protein